MLLLIIVLVLLFGGGGGYYGYSNYGATGGLVPLVLVIVVIWLLVGRGGHLNDIRAVWLSLQDHYRRDRRNGCNFLAGVG